MIPIAFSNFIETNSPLSVDLILVLIFFSRLEDSKLSGSDQVNAMEKEVRVCVGRFAFKVHLVVASPRCLYTVVQKLLRVHSMRLNKYCNAVVVVIFQELVSNYTNERR